eukprot:5293543-Amphidinium_carterae.1
MHTGDTQSAHLVYEPLYIARFAVARVAKQAHTGHLPLAADCWCFGFLAAVFPESVVDRGHRRSKCGPGCGPFYSSSKCPAAPVMMSCCAHPKNCAASPLVADGPAMRPFATSFMKFCRRSPSCWATLG